MSEEPAIDQKNSTAGEITLAIKSGQLSLSSEDAAKAKEGLEKKGFIFQKKRPLVIPEVSQAKIEAVFDPETAPYVTSFLVPNLTSFLARPRIKDSWPMDHEERHHLRNQMTGEERAVFELTEYRANPVNTAFGFVEELAEGVIDETTKERWSSLVISLRSVLKKKPAQWRYMSSQKIAEKSHKLGTEKETPVDESSPNNPAGPRKIKKDGILAKNQTQEKAGVIKRAAPREEASLFRSAFDLLSPQEQYLFLDRAENVALEILNTLSENPVEIPPSLEWSEAMGGKTISETSSSAGL